MSSATARPASIRDSGLREPWNPEADRGRVEYRLGGRRRARPGPVRARHRCRRFGAWACRVVRRGGTQAHVRAHQRVRVDTLCLVDRPRRDIREKRRGCRHGARGPGQLRCARPGLGGRPGSEVWRGAGREFRDYIGVPPASSTITVDPEIPVATSRCWRAPSDSGQARRCGDAGSRRDAHGSLVIQMPSGSPTQPDLATKRELYWRRSFAAASRWVSSSWPSTYVPRQTGRDSVSQGLAPYFGRSILLVTRPVGVAPARPVSVVRSRRRALGMHIRVSEFLQPDRQSSDFHYPSGQHSTGLPWARGDRPTVGEETLLRPAMRFSALSICRRYAPLPMK